MRFFFSSNKVSDCVEDIMYSASVCIWVFRVFLCVVHSFRQWSSVSSSIRSQSVHQAGLFEAKPRMSSDNPRVFALAFAIALRSFEFGMSLYSVSVPNHDFMLRKFLPVVCVLFQSTKSSYSELWLVLLVHFWIFAGEACVSL